MVFIDKVHNITKVMDHGGMVLLPTDASWCIAGDARNKIVLKHILNLKQGLSDFPVTLMVNSMDMFKLYFPRLHPRIETLLSFLERPLTLVIPVENSLIPNHLKQLYPSIAVRLSHDLFCNTIIDMIGGPLLISVARNSMRFPRSFAEISTAIIEKMDYVCKHRFNQSGFYPEVVARYNELGDLEFLRE
jgi:L-threonylcarbamoyladenylate synthase